MNSDTPQADEGVGAGDPEDRRWWPLFMADESMPAGRETPAAWLFTLGDGQQRYGFPAEDQDAHYGSRPISEGDVAEFICSDNLGTVTLSLDANGAPVWSRTIPAEANWLWDFDTETGGDTPEEFVRLLREFADDPPDEVKVYLTHQGGARLIFTALDGPPRFVAALTQEGR